MAEIAEDAIIALNLMNLLAENAHMLWQRVSARMLSSHGHGMALEPLLIRERNMGQTLSSHFWEIA